MNNFRRIIEKLEERKKMNCKIINMGMKDDILPMVRLVMKEETVKLTGLCMKRLSESFFEERSRSLENFMLDGEHEPCTSRVIFPSMTTLFAITCFLVVKSKLKGPFDSRMV